MSYESLQQFAVAYRQVRKDPQTLRLMAIIGIVAIPGLQRFWVGQVGIGLLYLLTWGLLLFGTITDIIKYKELAFAYNRKVAKRIAFNLYSGQGPTIIGEVGSGRTPGSLSQRQYPA